MAQTWRRGDQRGGGGWRNSMRGAIVTAGVCAEEKRVTPVAAHQTLSASGIINNGAVDAGYSERARLGVSASWTSATKYRYARRGRQQSSIAGDNVARRRALSFAAGGIKISVNDRAIGDDVVAAARYRQRIGGHRRRQAWRRR